MKKHINYNKNGQKKSAMSLKKAACVLLSFALTMGMTGCGKEVAEKVPELLEPVSTNESYRPVSYGDIGRMIIKSGTVVPTDYCYYYETSAKLSKVYVNVGDEVKEGTVLADVDNDAQDEDMDDGDASMAGDTFLDEGDGTSASDREFAHNIKQKIYQENQAELDWKIKACVEIKDKVGEQEARTEKAVNEENHRYDNLLYEYEQKKIKKEEAEKKKLKVNGTLKATHPGHVTYAKKFTDGDNSVSGGENVVVVSDDTQPYIEIVGEQFKKATYDIYRTMYKNMYAVVDGKKREICLYEYTNQEIAAAQSMGSLPYVRFIIKGVKDQSKVLKVGNSVSLYFSTSEAKNVLTVSNESIYEENGQKIVYVASASGAKERREIETGATDANYTEVVKGLKEGELVYYASDAITPANYSEYTVALDSCSKDKTIDSKSFAAEDLNSVGYNAPCDGRFKSIKVKKGQKVKKGDLLFVLDSGGGTAAVKDIENQISDENQNFTEQMKELDDQIIELSKQIIHYQKDKLATPTDAENNLYMAEQLTCQKNVLGYNKELLAHTHNSSLADLNARKEKLNKNNDGKGNISVYAEESGKVVSVSGRMDSAVKEGQRIVTIGSQDNVILAVSLSDDKIAINQKVIIKSKGNAKVRMSGVCVGTSGDSSRSYIQTDAKGNVHITKCTSSDELKYYIKVDNKEFYKSPASYQLNYPTVSYDNVVCIPNAMIYHESSKNSSVKYDYVWLISDGELVKQYVTLGEDMTSKTVVLTGLKEGDKIAKESASSGNTSPGKSDSDSPSGDDVLDDDMEE